METKTGIMKISELTRGNILVTIIIVGALTAGNIWLHRSEPSLGYDRYDNYGFALDYSVRMTLTEFGLGGPEPNESGGCARAGAKNCYRPRGSNSFKASA